MAKRISGIAKHRLSYQRRRTIVAHELPSAFTVLDPRAVALQLIQQLYRFRRVRDPRRRARRSGLLCNQQTSVSAVWKRTDLEIVGASRQELVADVQGHTPVDAAKEALAGSDAPGLVADVDKDIAAT
jgi:hypothetical protein